MELQSPSFALLLSLSFLFLFLVLNIWRKSNSCQRTPNLPPGPRKLPLIGNFHQLVGSLPHHRISELAKKHGPVMHIQLGELPTVVISSPEAAKEVLKEQDINFVDRAFNLAARVIYYNCKDIGFAPYGDYWRQLRKICILELLSSKRVQSFRSIREEEVSNLIRSISTQVGTPINFSKIVSTFAPGVIAKAAVRMNYANQESIIWIVQEAIEALGGFSIVDMFPSFKFLSFISGMRSKLMRMHEKEDKILDSIINEHRSNMKRTTGASEDEVEDLLDVLLKLQDNGSLEIPLTTECIKAIIMDILVGGIDTSRTVIEWAMSEMLRHPKILARAQEEVRQVYGRNGKFDEARLQELKFLTSIINETLRLHPPAVFIPRECRKTCEITGYEIQAKTQVMINTWMIGRDLNYWIEADRFYPERFLDRSIDYKGTDFGLIPFGAGRRMCPGMRFAMANIEIALARLLYHFDWKLPDGAKPESLDMTETFGITVGRKRELVLIPILSCPNLPVWDKTC